MRKRLARWAETLQSRIPFGSFGRNVLLVTAGTAGGQVLVLAASPLLSRLYTPEDWGALAVYASVLSFFYIASALRYELAIPIAEEKIRAAAVLVLAVGLVFVAAAVAAVAVATLGDVLMAQTDTAQLDGWLWLIPVGVLWGGLYKVFNHWAMRSQAYPIIARTKLAQGTAQVLAQVGLGMGGLAPAGLLVGDVLGRAGGTASLALHALRDARDALSRLTLNHVRGVALRFRRFPLISTGSGILNTGGLRLPPLLLAGFYGSAVAGYFGLGQTVLAGPISLLGRSVSQVFIGDISEAIREDPDRVRPLFVRTAKRLAAVGVLPAALLALFAPPAFELIFGAEWREAGVYARLLSPMLLLQLVVFPLSQTLNILERQGLQLAWDGLRLVLVLVALWLPSHLNLSGRYAVGFFSASMTSAYILHFGLSYRAIRLRGEPTY